jgi:type IV pilus assembly protein PilB
LRRKKRLGEMLLEAGLLTEEQLRQALGDHKKFGLKLGQFLVQQGIVSESEIVELISRQLKIAKYHPDKYPVDLGLSKIIPADIAQKYQVVPLRKKGQLLVIAMTDPLDIKAMDTIEVLANTEVEPVICTEQELNQMFGSLYGAYSDLDGVLESIEQVQYDADRRGPCCPSG